MLRCTCPTPAGVHAARKGGCYGRRTFARKERLFLCRSQLQGCTGQAENQVDSHRLSNPWKQEEGGSVPMEQRQTFQLPAEDTEAVEKGELFADYLERWLKIAKSTIAITTYSSYDGMMKSTIVP